MKKTYIFPSLREIDIIQKDCTLNVTSATNDVGDGEDFVKGETDWEEEITSLPSTSLWDEEW